MSLHVLLVERSALVRSGLRGLFEKEPDIAVVAEASNGRDAAALLTHLHVDVVVVSTAVDRDAIQPQAIAALRLSADVGIVCVSHWTRPREVEGVLGAGALGCVELSSASDVDLRSAVRLASRRERYLSPGLADGIVIREPAQSTGREQLTTREKEILVLIAQSKSNREIAQQLKLSMNTIAVHRNRMMKKIGVRKATALALFAAERGLLAGR